MNNWISTTERLPKHGEHVMVWIGNKTPMRGYWHETDGWYAYWFEGCQKVEQPQNVWFWQPFPSTENLRQPEENKELSQ